MKHLIQPAEAFNILKDHWPSQKIISIDLMSSLNHILAESIYLDRDQPPFDRVMMDGYAIRLMDWASGVRSFQVSGIQAAGEPSLKLNAAGNCIEIMTGAVLPENCDVVIPYEKTIRKDTLVSFEIDEIKPFLNVHRKGIDRKKNECVIEANTIIGPIEIGILASVGKNQVSVFAPLNMALVATGSELVQINESPKDYQIRSTNKETLSALMQAHGARVESFHLPDHEEKLHHFIQNKIDQFDVICFTGGVSMGMFDFLPQVLKDKRAEILFHGISQKPGKPMLAAKYKNSLIIGLPGNPVSAILCAVRYLLPLLSKNEKSVLLKQEIQNDSNLTQFKPVRLENNMAYMVSQNGSGDFMGLLGVDGFIEIPSKTHLDSASKVNFFSLDQQK